MNEAGGLVYCIDTSAFVDLVHMYPEKSFPGLWSCMSDLADSGRLVMYEGVRNECQDEVAQPWLEAHAGMVRPFSTDINRCLTRLQADLHADNQKLVDPGSTKDPADPFVVALAMASNLGSGGSYASGKVVVLQHEGRTNNRTGRVKIPDVCARYGIRCVTLVETVEIEGWVFHKVE